MEAARNDSAWDDHLDDEQDAVKRVQARWERIAHARSLFEQYGSPLVARELAEQLAVQSCELFTLSESAAL